ncbi:hypothetical protein ACWERV_23305 [Streptomyces sp. NPDC004031]
MTADNPSELPEVVQVPLLRHTGSLLMDLSSTVGAQPTDTSVNAVAAELLGGMDAEQASITIGLGLLVQRAAEVEYILHGIYAHLGNKEFPYADEPQGSVTNIYIKKSLTRLGSIPSEQIPPEDRQALIHDLELCKESFAQRNLFIHGCWTFDDEVQAWRVVKGQKPDSVVFDLAYSEDVLALAAEFARLNAKLTAWDAHFFGEPGDPEAGQASVSTKKIQLKHT